MLRMEMEVIRSTKYATNRKDLAHKFMQFFQVWTENALCYHELEIQKVVEHMTFNWKYYILIHFF